MLTFFPRYFTGRAIVAYILTLFIVSMCFMGNVLSFSFMLFGFFAVVLFFALSRKLTVDWQTMPPDVFIKSLFIVALLIRLSYVVFIYFYYIQQTGIPHAFDAQDELFYVAISDLWRTDGFEELQRQIELYTDFSDRGYCWWLGFETLLFGSNVIWPRIVKCLIDALSCIIIYKLASRNFGESVGKMTAVFYMLMPNFWYYCGVTLKETEMVFLTILFVERVDYLLRVPHVKAKHLILPVLAPLLLFTFRTALAAVLLLALGMTFFFSSGRQIKAWQKVVYLIFFGIVLVFTVRVEMLEEIEQLWSGRAESQQAGMEWRAEREGGNSFARYAGSAVFAPLIFSIPFPTMVDIPGQENQMMLNGVNFIKNILSGFTIFALFLLLIRGDWRKHVLPIAALCGYLLVLVFSNFAQSERFHLPALPFELMFAAYGISQCEARQKRWFRIWVVGICVVNIGWSWFKLAGRGMV